MTGFAGLAVPGPTNMPFQVRQAMDVPLEDHRAPNFPEYAPLFEDLKKVFPQQAASLSFPAPEQVAGNQRSPIRSMPVTRC